MEEFCNRLYELRKKAGMSQEALAEKLNVTRQTLSKWELGESTPDMEKLIALSDLFDISLDELMLGKAPVARDSAATCSGGNSAPGANGTNMTTFFEKNVLTDKNKQKAKKIGKVALIAFGALLAVDIISMIIYFALFGAPS